MKFVKLLKANKDWQVLRRHHDTEDGKEYYYIEGPNGIYQDEDGNTYKFDTKEDALEELDYLKAEHKFDKKSADNNIFDQGDFIDNGGTWKKVLDKDIELNILGQTVQLKLWHYEIETEDNNLKRDFNKEDQHFLIVNAREISKNLEKHFINELKKQLNIEGEYHTKVSIPTSIPEEGKFIK